MHYLGICCIAKDESAIKEWVDYHLIAGAEMIYLYDNGSRIPLAKVLRHYVQAGVVHVEPFPGRQRQLAAYVDCLERFGPQCRWLAFIDADEFIVPKQASDLRELLLDYEEYAGLAVNWAVFGSSGHEIRPAGLMTECYHHRLPESYGENHLVKSIVRPALTTEVRGVHHCAYKPGHFCVNENGWPVFGPFTPHTSRRVQLNHYFFRSREEFAAKLSRGHADLPPSTMKYSMSDFDAQTVMTSSRDESIARFLPELRRAANSPLPQSALRDRSERPLAWHLAQVERQFKTNKPESALKAATEAVIRYPDAAEGWVLRTTLQRSLDLLEDALRSVRRAIALRESPEAMLQLFLLQDQSGDKAAAANTARYILWRMGRPQDKQLLSSQPHLKERLEQYLTSR